MKSALDEAIEILIATHKREFGNNYQWVLQQVKALEQFYHKTSQLMEKYKNNVDLA